MFLTKSKKLINVLLFVTFLIVPTKLAFAQSTDLVQVGVFDKHTISPDSSVEIPIEIKNVIGLYALDIALKFDPTVVTAEDADPATPGIQLALGNFLDPGMVLYNTIDNETGTVHFVMTQRNPSEAKNGSGILLVIYFKALKQGESALTFTNAQLSTRDGIEIPCSKMDSAIKVVVNAPTIVATTIPVQQPETLVQIPTEMPTSTPTITPTIAPTASLIAIAGPGVESAPEGTSSSPETGEGSSRFSLLNSWWIVLIILVLVIAAGGYLFYIRKTKK